MNAKDLYRGRFLVMTVIACLLAVLVLVPGFDSVGRIVMGSFAGFLLLLGLWNLWKCRRAASEAVVYTPLTLHNAPLELQIRSAKRGRWVVLGASLVYISMKTWDFHELESGAVESIRLPFPLDFVYQKWGSGVTLSIMIGCGLAVYGLMEMTVGILQAKALAEAKADGNP